MCCSSPILREKRKLLRRNSDGSRFRLALRAEEQPCPRPPMVDTDLLDTAIAIALHHRAIGAEPAPSATRPGTDKQGVIVIHEVTVPHRNARRVSFSTTSVSQTSLSARSQHDE